MSGVTSPSPPTGQRLLRDHDLIRFADDGDLLDHRFDRAVTHTGAVPGRRAPSR
jgi:hypothetical protein